MSFNSFPFVVGWELTLACNLECTHCASTAGRKRTKELTYKESLAICNQFPDLLVQEVIFTGGEPLMNPNWFSIARYLKNLGIKCGLVTNGILVNEDVINKMRENGLNAVGVSLDGPQAIHDRIRGKEGLYEKTIKAIELLVSSGIDVTIITSVSGINISLLENIRQTVSSIGAWKWQLQPIFPLGRGRGNDFLRLTPEQFLKLGKFIHKNYINVKNKGLEIVPADSCGYFSLIDLDEYNWQGCGAGNYSCGIMSNGKVKGCLSWPDNIIEGDLRIDNLWTIWFQDKAFQYQRAFDISDFHGECRECEVAIKCGGGCQAMSLATTGRWHADPFCYKRIIEDKKSKHDKFKEIEFFK